MSADMDLSPNDIRNYEFPNQMRGYGKDEVESFKEKVANIIESLKHENLKLSMEIESLKSQLAGLKQFEDTIKNAAIDARRNADMTIANAKKEAAVMLAKAKAEYEQTVANRSHKITEIENQLQKIELTKKSYIAKVRGLLHSHLELIDDIASAENIKEKSEESLEIIDSAEMENKKRETFATLPTKDKGIKTEEAAASDTIEEPSSEDMDEELQSPAGEEIKAHPAEPSKSKDIDPELAAALESYQKKVESESRRQGATPPRQSPLPPDNVTITNARAEEVPPEFIPVKSAADEEPFNTDKVNLETGEPEMPTEHNAINIEGTANKKSKNAYLDPNNLADELDEVVAKFEEEMDKAEKS